MIKNILCLLVLIFCEFNNASKDHEEKSKPYLKALTIVSEARDGLGRLLRSASIYGINMTVLGIGEWVLPNDLQTWLIRNDGLWQKIVLIKREIEKFKNDENVVILMVDGFDVIFCAGEEEILKKFHDFKANIVFGAEVRGYDGFIEPNERYKNLNSGMIIGYAPTLYKILSTYKRNMTEGNDQPYYASLYLNDQIRNDYNIKIDHKATIVQNLLFAEDDMELEFHENDTRLVNKIFKTRPSIIHGNAYLGMLSVNSFGNYIAKSWNPTRGCMVCDEGRINLKERMTWDYPKVLLGIFIDRQTPFLEEMLRKTSEQKYPKERIYLYVLNTVPTHEQLVRKWVKSHGGEYYNIKYMSSADNITSPEAKQSALELCKSISCDVFFNVEGIVQLDNPNTLRLLISYNRSIIAPVMSRTGKLFSTFWGGIYKQEYKRSFDYIDVVERRKRGIWNVPMILYVYLIWRSVMENPLAELNYLSFRDYDNKRKGDFAFCTNNLANETFMYAVNLEEYGYLTTPLKEEDAGFQNELWQVNANFVEWERRYIHSEYRPNSFKKVIKDVYTIPVFTKRFCEDVFKIIPADFFNKANQTYVPLENFEYERIWMETFKKHIKPAIDSLLKEKHVSESPRRNFIYKYDLNSSFDAEDYSPYLRIILAENTKQNKGETCSSHCSFPEIPVCGVTVFLNHQPNFWKESRHYELISLLFLE